MLMLENVTKRYSGQAVVDHVTLELAGGVRHVLIGRSGCGKSTLLRLLIGLVQPDEGRVLFDGAPLDELNLLEVRRRFGYVIQEGGLFPHLTARDNVTLMARYLKRPPAETQRRLDELVALTRFPAGALVRYPDELSGGQRQRVSLMRALFLDPDVLLLDEPLGALDPMIRSELQTELNEIFAAWGKTVVLVTHDLHEAAFFSDHLVLLNQGRVVQRGSIRQLIDAPDEPFVSDFIRSQRHLLAGDQA